MAIVYKHTTKDTGVIFYIGIGKTDKRAYSRMQRTKIWKNIVNKHSYTVEILNRNLTWEEACEKEKELIALYGKRSLGTGTLINITDGGDGRLGAYPSEDTKKKMSNSHKGINNWSKGCLHNEETKIKLRDYYKKYGSPNKGKTKTEEHRKKISNSLKGRPGTWNGRKHSEESKTKMKKSHGSGENNARYGVKHGKETLERMKEVALKRDKVVCPHCQKEGQLNAMQRWHFNNCKYLK